MCYRWFDKLHHNNQDENEPELYTFDQVPLGVKNVERCLSIPIFFLAFIIFSLICFSNDKPGSKVSSKRFCSFTCTTADPFLV